MQDKSPEPNLYWLALAAVILAVGFVLPSIIAFARGHERRWQILVGNLLLGWTGLFWAYALIIAIAPFQREPD